MTQKLSARIAAVLLVLHGLIEIVGLFFSSSIPQNMTAFGGMTGDLLAKNAPVIAMYGALWGISRFIAAWGTWSLRKWVLILGILLSLVTLVAAITIIPAGVMDTFLALPVLVCLLYAWFGNEVGARQDC